MTKQIKDYPELKNKMKSISMLATAVWGNIGVVKSEIVEQELIEMQQQIDSQRDTISTQRSLEAQLQGEINDLEVKVHEQQQQIDSLTEQNSKMTDVMENNGWLSKEVVKLTEQNKELQERNQWISVEDRLPDDEQACLIMIDVKPNIEYGKYREHGEYWSANWCERRTLHGTYKVTHWMPLPKLNKESK